jgi:hypothetical protein
VAHVVYYLYYRALGKTYKQILDSFTTNVVKNDRKVEIFVKSIPKLKSCCVGTYKNKKCQSNTCKCVVHYEAA